MSRRLLKPFLRLLLGTVAAVTAAALTAAGLLLWSLRPAPGEWALPVRLGGVETTVSAPMLLRLGTHPLALKALDGRHVDTRWGRLALRFTGDQSAEIDCTPCRFRLDAVGTAPVTVGRVTVGWVHLGGGVFKGQASMVGATGTPAVTGTWRAHLSDRSLAATVALPATPIARWLQVLAPEAPEWRVARIEGEASAVVNVLWSVDHPRGRWQVQPRLEGFTVSGLGTEALRNAAVGRCAAPAATATAASRARPSTATARPAPDWLARAVVAAEDQRFFEHPGYDLQAWVDAWNANQQAQALAGASTLSQQLAKLLFTGDERTLTRKLRELVWAVELDRTLGKARVLSLYLQVAPWGAGVCGADDAARHYLGKPAARLTPLEAAWMASLLRNPDREAARWSPVPSAALDRDHFTQVLKGLRGMRRERRQTLLDAASTWQPQRRVGSLES